MIHWFFRCVNCGEWYYSRTRIKSKKCIRCNRSFQFEHSNKFKKDCSVLEAIALIKYLKIQE